MQQQEAIAVGLSDADPHALIIFFEKADVLRLICAKYVHPELVRPVSIVHCRVIKHRIVSTPSEVS